MSQACCACNQLSFFKVWVLQQLGLQKISHLVLHVSWAFLSLSLVMGPPKFGIMYWSSSSSPCPWAWISTSEAQKPQKEERKRVVPTIQRWCRTLSKKLGDHQKRRMNVEQVLQRSKGSFWSQRHELDLKQMENEPSEKT